MTIERGNTKHGPARDDELAHELDETIKGTLPGTAEEWRDAEPPDASATGNGPGPETNRVQPGDHQARR
ncbi:hypothetical protein [Nocardia sp. MW-W600-9]